VLKRLWNALKPPPAVQPRWRPTRRQNRILVATGFTVISLSVAGGVWQYIASAPDRAQVQFDFGMRLMGAGAYRTALDNFDRSIAIWPHSPGVFYNRGIAHRLLGEYDAAMADFSQTILLNPSHGGAYTERASIAQERGDVQHAMEDYSHAVDLAPTANGYYQRGRAYLKLGQAEKALNDFGLAIHEQPNAPYLYRARASVRRSLGDENGYAADRNESLSLEHAAAGRAWVDGPLPKSAASEQGTTAPAPEKEARSTAAVVKPSGKPPVKASR
jgi:tetratricopeptide (TPR) repeat protein